MECDVIYEELAAFAFGELDPQQRARIGRHLDACDRCRKRIEALRRADELLTSLPPLEPPTWAILAARRALSEAADGRKAHEIMTLAEVAQFLRISAEQLGEVVEDLPAFELAGQVRVRRARLIEWIQQRERDYTRRAAASWAAHVASDDFGKGAA